MCFCQIWTADCWSGHESEENEAKRQFLLHKKAAPNDTSSFAGFNYPCPQSGDEPRIVFVALLSLVI